MEKKLQALYGLKFNPFAAAVPVSALHPYSAIEQFCWRIEHQLGEGGFALVTGEPGTGKSAALRIVAHRLSNMRDAAVGHLTRPQASVGDFYRELGHLFGVVLSPHNRWAGARALRERWLAHIDAALTRPVLIVDEAQEMKTPVLSELRLLSSAELDSQAILTVVLAGDERLTQRLQTAELLPIASRVRTRLRTEGVAPANLRDALNHLLEQAGNPKIMTPSVAAALCEHAAGNLRVMANMANDLLNAAVRKELAQIDDTLYFATFSPEPQKTNRRRQ